ncbi:(+)-neomenthol dehydrogenase-like isoform X1 [Typha angustifolia]|uniref:(+)-neomenthol dehydrogenase-like isoform X1 n=1 Tax=Typha angustifolia TaxID=59011 RepID=UPI003C2B38F6
MESTIPERIAVVTGSNKGIGLEICRQLLSKGVKVVLTARDEERGIAAVKKLQESGASDVVFHQLDVADVSSAEALGKFIQTQFGKLDILVNNAAVSGAEIEPQALTLSNQPGGGAFSSLLDMTLETHEKAEECININYYGTKRMCKVFISLLQLSQAPKIINLSSGYGRLKCIPGEAIRKKIANINDLTEERLDALVESFLNDFKEEKHKENGWPSRTSAYKVSKVALSAYTRILAKEHPMICTNCVDPGFVKTDINWNTGTRTVEEGAKGPVMLALLPNDSPSGLFYCQTEVSSFE